MAYSVQNFKTKKALKEALAAGGVIPIYSPGPFGCKENGQEFLEGPHYPAPHRWYAKVDVKDGVVVKVY
jgi:hypothetical protein